MRCERLESRMLLAANVANFGGDLFINGSAGDDIVEIAVVDQQVEVTQKEVVTEQTSYEDIQGPGGSDITNFFVGDGDVSAFHSGGASITRGFPPGYADGARAFATPPGNLGQIDFTTPVDYVLFQHRLIVEITPDGGGEIRIFGTEGTTIVTPDGSGTPQNNDWNRYDSRLDDIGQIVRIEIEGTGLINLDQLEFSGQEVTQVDSFPVATVDTILATLNNGDDTLINRTDIPSALFGGRGNDTLVGGTNSDQIFGGIGNDNMWGGGGVDMLFGGRGNDLFEGEERRFNFLVGLTQPLT